MLGMASSVRRALLAVALLIATGCTQQPAEPPRELTLYQSWELQPGDELAGHQILGGLGDISLALNGDAIYAPFDGKVQPHKPTCVIFSSEELPVYLFRLCGLSSPKFGPRSAGEPIATGNDLRFALLNKQPDGRWAMVEPSKKIIEQMLLPP